MKVLSLDISPKIFNEIIEQTNFPKDLQLANITPLYKKDTEAALHWYSYKKVF